MSLLPHTLLNSTTNEDQTLEIHSEILEPLSHSQNISRFEIPHKNILDSDSVLVWNVFWDGYIQDPTGAQGVAVPLLDAGLYDTILRARLFVNGKIISELNEVGKYLTMRGNFKSHEVKVEKDDLYSYADHRFMHNKTATGVSSGQLELGRPFIQRTPGSRELGPAVPNTVNGLDYRVEASLKLHQLFAILKDAQLDTNNIEGKIMIEIDWNYRANNNKTALGDSVSYLGGIAGNLDRKGIKVETPRLILDFLTYNAEVQAQIKNTIYGDGPGVNMPFREVALVRKTLNSNVGGAVASVDINMGMTGRAVQKIWVAKVMDIGTGANKPLLLGDCRSDLLEGQKWNIRVNDLMIYDRDVDNRAEEYNYLQQAGEKKLTLPPATFEICRDGVGDRAGYNIADNVWAENANVMYYNGTEANKIGKGNRLGCPTGPIRYLGEYGGAAYPYRGHALVRQGTAVTSTNLSNEMMGHRNYLGVNLARYKNGAESPLNAMRIGSTPILFTLERSGANDASVTQKSGTVYFWVEYLKMMNLKNGQITVMDL